MTDMIAKPFRQNHPLPALIRTLLIFLAFLIFLPLSGPAEGQDELPAAIRSILEAPRYRYARWGIHVLDLQSGKAVYAVNADTLFGPASVTKLFTAAAALDILGPNATFSTVVYRSGTVDAAGRLNGQLILSAGGDIFFSGMADLAKQVKAAGISAVRGDITVDDRLFKPHRIYSVARPGRLLYVLSPAVVQGNLLDITIRPGRVHTPAHVTWHPALPHLHVTSHIRTVGHNEQEKIEFVENAPEQIILTGQIPAASPPVTKTAPIGDPAQAVRAALIQALKKEGVRMQLSSRKSLAPMRRPDRGDAGRLQKVAEKTSPPLSEYLRSILKTSHNLGADTLPLLVAVKHGDSTFEEGMKRGKGFLIRAGIDPGAVSLGDGSGISTANLVTPRSVVQLLAFMTTHEHHEAFRSGLPIIGVDGTLTQAVGDHSPAKGKIMAKTGTIGLFDLMNDSGFVQCKSLAGYMTASSGRPLAFALFVNHVHATDAPDRKSVLKLTQDVGGDLARIAELIYMNQ